MLDEVIQHPTTEPASSKDRAHVHALDLRVLSPNEQDAAASGRVPIVSRDEEPHAVAQQLLDAETVAALAGIERRQMRVEVVDERGGVRRVRTLLGYDDGQLVLLA
jgi:hypothetical protein